MKNQLKQKNCKNNDCGKKFMPARPMQTACSPMCALAVGRQNAARKAKKASGKAVRDLNRTSLSWQHKATQKAFNRMRVLQELLWFKKRGLEPTCISCGKPLGGDRWSCGHFKTVGSNSLLRYDERNTHIQHLKSCNSSLSGDIYGTGKTHGYIEGLKIRFGEEEGQAIVDYCDNSPRKADWKPEQLEQMRKKFNAEIRRLEKLL